MLREFGTAAASSGALGALLAGARDLLSVVTGAPFTTDNASVSLHAAGAPGPGGRRPALLAVSETPNAAYLVDPASLATLEKVGVGACRQGLPSNGAREVASDGAMVGGGVHRG